MKFPEPETTEYYDYFRSLKQLIVQELGFQAEHDWWRHIAVYYNVSNGSMIQIHFECLTNFPDNVRHVYEFLQKNAKLNDGEINLLCSW